MSRFEWSAIICWKQSLAVQKGMYLKSINTADFISGIETQPILQKKKIRCCTV
jgi:hypothetical protein